MSLPVPGTGRRSNKDNENDLTKLRAKNCAPTPDERGSDLALQDLWVLVPESSPWHPTSSRSEQQQTGGQHEDLPTPRDAQLGTSFVPSEDGLERHSDGTSECTSEEERK